MSRADSLLKQDSRFSGHFSKSVLQTLRFAYQSSKWVLSFCLLMGFLGRIFLLSNANIIGLWVDHFCTPQAGVPCRPVSNYFINFTDGDFLKWMALTTGLGFILTWLFRIFFSSISAKAVSQIYDETTYRTSRYPMIFFDRNPTGRIVTRFSSDYGNVFRLFGGPLAEFLSIIFDLIGMIILIAVASPYYLFTVLFTALLNFLVFRFNREKLRSSRRELSASRSPAIAHFSETAQGASTIRSFNRQGSFSGRFQKLDSYFLEQKRRVVTHVMFFSFQMNSLTAALFLITGLLGHFLLKSGTVSIGSLGVAFGFIALSGNTVQMFFEWLTQFEEAMIGVERMDNYLHKPIELGARLPSFTQFPTEQWKLSSSEDESAQSSRLSQEKAAPIKFENVWFRYGEDLPYVLKGLSFEVKPGERFGIIGRTGSGKSSLIQALFYLYPIEKGQIQVAGFKPQLLKSETGVDLEVYRRAMSFISQDPILFKGSLLENLVCDPKITQSQIFEALNRVGLDEWANEKGLKIQIEEKGKNLSLGEKQLICMARCLLQQSPIVVMDEATSSVDPKSEEIMVKATEEFFAGRTQVVIAHRLSTLRNCDRILWLQDGKIQMLGETKEVLQVFQDSNLSP